MGLVKDAVSLFTLVFDRCHSCYHSPYPTKDTNKSYLGYLVCETEFCCGKCGEPYDYFAYGSYMRDSDRGQLESEYPELNWTFTHIMKTIDSFRIK